MVENRAMLIAALVLVVLWLSLVTLVHEVRDDGYGHRSAPASLQDWSGPTMPSAPYRDLVER